MLRTAINRTTTGSASSVAPLSLSRCFSSSASSLHYQAPLTDIRFLLNEVYDYQSHAATLKNTGGELADADMVDMVLSEMGKFAENELAPINEGGDKVGCKWVDEHTVITPPGFKAAYDEYAQGGWQGLNYPEQYGGQGLPGSLSLVSADITSTACWTWTMYPGLSKGAINTILSHCTDELKDTYLPRMVSGEWTGTMCLTEPQCGSDLAQVTTKAVPNGDGTFKITGTKIFISCGEHDLTDNIIHCVLARLPGAPEGTKGISLFLVPKRKLDAEGNPGDLNGAKIGRIEDKMGCHGSSTCEINFEDAEGYLIGTENRGLNHMFTFINTSRVGTAVQGIAAAESSFQRALPYAQDRLAMRSLSGIKNPDGPADPIIVHPDVRRMLLTQKAIAEGGRSMVYECALLSDKMQEAVASGDEAAAKKVDDKLGFLTPILKGFLTETGVEAANMGMQVFGGHGYIKSNGVEQIFRDARIAALWEGTTGIQALDLLGRKIMQHGKMRPINDHCSALYKEAFGLITGGATMGVRRRALTLLRHAVEWHLLTYRIALNASSNKDAVGVASVDYLMYAGYVSMAQHWLRMEQKAALLVAKGDGDARFLDTKIRTSTFYFDHLLPRARGHVKGMFTPVDSMMGIKSDEFAFY